MCISQFAKVLNWIFRQSRRSQKFANFNLYDLSRYLSLITRNYFPIEIQNSFRIMFWNGFWILLANFPWKRCHNPATTTTETCHTVNIATIEEILFNYFWREDSFLSDEFKLLSTCTMLFIQVFFISPLQRCNLDD